MMRRGDFVELTDAALRQGLLGRAKSAYGRVVRVELPNSVVIRRDGVRRLSTYDFSFWRIVDRKNVPRAIQTRLRDL